MSEPIWHTITVTIAFLSENDARIAKQALDVDRELQPHAVKRVLEVQGTNLVAKLSTLTIRLARLVTNAFLENVDLIVHTLDEFGPR